MEQKNALFEQMPVRKAFFKLALPVVLSMVVSLVYNMVDTYFIAKTGNAHLVAGVALGSPVFTLMIAVGDIFGLGGSSFISRLFGQKRDQDGKRLSVFCFYGALFTGVGITALLLLLRTPLLTVLGAQADTVQYARDYYTWIAVGAPFIILSFTPCNQLRTEGFANASMIGSILGAVVNIVLDPVLIFGCKLGAAGAAIATVIGYVFTDLYYVWFLLRRSRHLSVDIRLLRVSWQEVGQVFAIGIPASITNIAQSFCVLITNRFLVPYGTDKVAAMGIAMKANMLVVMLQLGLAQGVQPLVGYCYGANKLDRMRRSIRFSCVCNIVLGTVITVVYFIFTRQVVSVFIDDPAVIDYGVKMLRALMISGPVIGCMFVLNFSFQGMGKGTQSMILSLSRQGLIYFPLLIIMNKTVGLEGIIWSQAVADLVCTAMSVVMFLLVVRKLRRQHSQKTEV